MYEVDDQDQVIELHDVPQASVGAPIPFVMSDEHNLVLAYYLEATPEGWDGTSIRIVGPTSEGEPVALIHFSGYTAYMFGPPNDEAFDGHPLASRGLRPYGAYRVDRSSWVRRLERMNTVHPYHRPEHYRELNHFIFAFHDSTFECMARGFSTWVGAGSIRSLLPEMEKRLAWDAV